LSDIRIKIHVYFSIWNSCESV